MTKSDLIFIEVYKPLLLSTVYSFFYSTVGVPSYEDVITVFRSGELSKLLQLTATNDSILL